MRVDNDYHERSYLLPSYSAGYLDKHTISKL